MFCREVERLRTASFLAETQFSLPFGWESDSARVWPLERRRVVLFAFGYFCFSRAAEKWKDTQRAADRWIRPRARDDLSFPAARELHPRSFIRNPEIFTRIYFGFFEARDFLFSAFLMLRFTCARANEKAYDRAIDATRQLALVIFLRRFVSVFLKRNEFPRGVIRSIEARESGALFRASSS